MTQTLSSSVIILLCFVRLRGEADKLSSTDVLPMKFVPDSNAIRPVVKLIVEKLTQVSAITAINLVLFLFNMREEMPRMRSTIDFEAVVVTL